MASLRIGTRGSQLALVQAHSVASLLQTRAGVATEIVVISTSGDRLAEAPLSEIGGKRLFVKEIEEALLAGTIDLAVHSGKDMPAVLPDGLMVAAVLPREDPRDALVLPRQAGAPGDAAPEAHDRLIRTLGSRPRIGTSSVRRSAQLARLFEAPRIAPIRGNLDTRLRKLDEGTFDAIVLAAAGLRRLEQAGRISAFLPADLCVPAPAQGIVAVEVRADDAATRALVAGIDDAVTATAFAAERAVVQQLGGGCQMPIGAHAAVHGAHLSVTAVVLSLDGTRALRAADRGSAAHPQALGRSVAEQLLAAGADDVLADIRRVQAAVDGLQP
jgi:hydroxymethylbilane synthase